MRGKYSDWTKANCTHYKVKNPRCKSGTWGTQDKISDRTLERTPGYQRRLNTLPATEAAVAEAAVEAGTPP